MTNTPTILWFRQDLRLQDNPALAAAVKNGAPIIPVFILDDEGEGRWKAGGASRWWLHHSLTSLDASLRNIGSRLVIANGNSAHVLEQLARETNATAVYWNRRYEPLVIARDSAIKTLLSEADVEAKSFNGALLNEPHTVANKEGKPFQVFTPYWRNCLTLDVEAPLKFKAKSLLAPDAWPHSLDIADLDLLPAINWDGGLRATWEPGEAGAAKRMKQFMKGAVHAYADTRNLPDRDSTSMLSPWLHFGEISPRQVWAAVEALSKESLVFPPSEGARVFLAEVGWREFGYYLLYHFPHTTEHPLRKEFEHFPWATDPKGTKLRAWQRGLTGYPIVDAGMRQLWETGWMHNRVRMVVASFLVKHLRLPWLHGAEWFWDTLVDADLASNTLGWQWTAGCGADASPYFRIFAPVLQGKKFDVNGDYVRRYVPELAQLPTEYIHAPWEAPAEVLAAAGVTLGGNYPKPIVDHAAARDSALAAFKQLRS